MRHAVRKSRDHFHCALPLFEVAVARPRFHVESHFRVFAYNSSRRDLPTVIITPREADARYVEARQLLLLLLLFLLLSLEEPEAARSVKETHAEGKRVRGRPKKRWSGCDRG